MNTILENIMQQPKALSEIQQNYLNDDAILLRLKTIRKRSFSNIILTGMGTSYYSGYPAYLYLLENGIANVQWIDASELLHYGLTSITHDTLLILISQSGESYEIVQILQQIQKSHTAPVIVGLTMTNNKSYLHDHADIALTLSAYEETSLGAFKSYTGSTLVLMLLAVLISHDERDYLRIKQEIGKLHQAMENNIHTWMQTFEREIDYTFSSTCLIGRGPAFSAASMGALIITELSRCNAFAISGGQFRHGPIEMVSNQINHYIILAPAGRTSKILVRLAGDLAEYNAKVLLLSDSMRVPDHANMKMICMPDIDEYLSPILYALPLQLFAYHYSRHKDLIPGEARIISKVTRFE